MRLGLLALLLVGCAAPRLVAENGGTSTTPLATLRALDDRWRGAPFDLDEFLLLLPVEVTAHDRALRLCLADFVLTDEKGRRLAVIDARPHAAPPRRPDGYATWVWTWSPIFYPSRRPPVELTANALPQGALAPGTSLRGYLAFPRRARAEGRKVRLTWRIHDAADTPQGTAVIDLSR